MVFVRLVSKQAPLCPFSVRTFSYLKRKVCVRKKLDSVFRLLATGIKPTTLQMRQMWPPTTCGALIESQMKIRFWFLLLFRFISGVSWCTKCRWFRPKHSRCSAAPARCPTACPTCRRERLRPASGDPWVTRTLPTFRPTTDIFLRRRTPECTRPEALRRRPRLRFRTITHFRNRESKFSSCHLGFVT